MTKTNFLKLHLLLFLTLMLPAPSQAYVYNQQECTYIANNLNATLPMNVDKQTILASSVCFVSGGSTTFTYTYELTFDPDVKMPKDFKQKIINRFCSNPDTREFLNHLSVVKMDYYNGSGNFYDRIKFNNQDCRS